MTNEYIPWFEPYITNEEIKAVSAAVKFSESTLAKHVTMFERNFAEYLGCKHAVAIMNGTCAIHLALLALDIKPKDEVIVPSFTFIGTTNPILYVGAKPIFVDIDPITYNMAPEKIEDAITPRTKAIIPVHMAGHPAEMDKIMDIANKHNLPVIEDSAEAHGATYKGKKAGSIGRIGCFSFACNKNMTTLEGGMVVTNDDKIADKVRLLRAHAYDPEKWGTPDFFHHIALAYNYRMTDLQAALGLVQLKRLEWVNKKRKGAVEYYNKLLSKIEGIQTPIASPNVDHVYFMYLLRFANQSEKKSFRILAKATFE